MDPFPFLALFLALSAARDSQTCKPARPDSWDLFTSKRTAPNATIESPNWPALRAKGEWFTGSFMFTVVQRSPAATDSIRRGSLEILPGRDERRIGTSDIDFQAWRIPGAVYSAASRDSTRPGVVFERDKQGRVLLVISGAEMEDAGILFAVFQADSSGFSGMWVSGAAVTRAPKGYFCAVR